MSQNANTASEAQAAEISQGAAQNENTEITHKKKKWRPISHEKNTRLDKSCVTMTDFMVKIYEKTELSDVICEEFSKSSGLISKANFEKNNQY